MEIVHADMNGFKNDVDSLTAQLSVMGDPARQDLFFPCIYINIYLTFIKSCAYELMDRVANVVADHDDLLINTMKAYIHE